MWKHSHNPYFISSYMYFLNLDRLGSYAVITDDTGQVKQRLGYDVWGNRVLDTNWTVRAEFDNGDFDYIFRRGFTGHEHLGSFGIINMNGRIYDPNIASFFSPDPYVVDATSTQAFNRYSYCLNNPLMYTDPSGELAWFVPIIICAAVFGTGNLAVQAIQNPNITFGEGLKAFGQGAIVGAAVGALWAAPAILPALGVTSETAIGIASVVQTTMSIYGGVQAAVTTGGMIAGIGVGLQTGDWSTLENAGKIALGNFALDENSFGGGILQGISRHTWEMFQTAVGHAYTQGRNAQGNVDRVDYLGGATFAIDENKGYNDGVTFGNFININDQRSVNGNFANYVSNNPLYMHEYGHTFDSRLFGLSYLFAVGLPSLISAANSKGIDEAPYSTHRKYWTETRANRWASKYFGKYYGVDWNFPKYPLGR